MKAENELLNHLRVVMEKQEKEEVEMLIVREWQDIARAFDRFLFLLFTSVNVLATVSLLVLKPMTKRINLEDFIP